MKRPNFYSDGSFIPYKLPQDFRKSLSREACGVCAMYSNRRSYCGVYRTNGVKDNDTCNKWRPRFFKR